MKYKIAEIALPYPFKIFFPYVFNDNLGGESDIGENSKIKRDGEILSPKLV